MSTRTYPAVAMLGTGGVHVVMLLLLGGLLARQTPITPPELPALQLVSAAQEAPPKPVAQAQSPKPAARTPETRRQSRQPEPVRPAPVVKPAPAPAAAQPAANSVTTAPPAPAATEAAPAPAAPVQEPLYKGAYLDNPKPVYPPLSVELSETGIVRLTVHVSAEGLPTAVSVAHSSGFPRLDRAAVTAVQRWKFVPAKRGKEPIAYTFIVPVEFSLKTKP